MLFGRNGHGQEVNLMWQGKSTRGVAAVFQGVALGAPFLDGKGSVYTLFSYIYTPDFLHIHPPDLVSACRWRNGNQNIANARVNTTSIFVSYYSYIINTTSIELKPPPEGLQASTLEELIIKVQKHAGKEGYAIIKKRTKKKLSTDSIYKAWLRCNYRGKFTEGRGFRKRLYISSRLIKYLFEYIVKEEKDILEG